MGPVRFSRAADSRSASPAIVSGTTLPQLQTYFCKPQELSELVTRSGVKSPNIDAADFRDLNGGIS